MEGGMEGDGVFVSARSGLHTHIYRNMLMPAEIGHCINRPLSGTPLLQVSSAGNADKRYLQGMLSYQNYELSFGYNIFLS